MPWLEGLYNVVFPNLCTVCHRTLIQGEKHLCLHCLVDLPRTNLHTQSPNIIHERLMSIGLPIEKATSLFYYFRESPFKAIIIDTKYHGRPSVGQTLSAEHAEELITTGFFDGIDYIIPVPLHYLKLITRGYNQAERIASGLSSVTGIPVINALKAAYHPTQTRKNPHERLKNVQKIYSLREKFKEIIENRHVLLLDDVITTGATLLSCITAIKALSPSTRISVYSLAITKIG